MKLLRAALPALSVILAAGAAQAADDWEFSVSPYVWGPGIVGDSQVPPDGPSADIDITFKDILSHITGAFMGTAEARYGRFGVLGDAAFVKFTVKPDVELGGAPVINSKVAVSTNATTIAGLALLVGVDRFMSECRALTNLVGNGVATLVIARWEGDLDRDRLREALDRGPPATLTAASTAGGAD